MTGLACENHASSDIDITTLHHVLFGYIKVPARGDFPNAAIRPWVGHRAATGDTWVPFDYSLHISET